MDETNAVLVLADGTVVKGRGFGAEKESVGEVVFNTSMTGYQEALTDPSYKHQILMLTYPLAGNYGVNDDDFESEKIHTEGFVVREIAKTPVHGKLKNTLGEFLENYGIPGISGVDTRFLTRKIRSHGVMNGILKYPFCESELEDLKEKARKLESISNFDLIDSVTTKEVERYNAKSGGGRKTVVLIDCGEKKSIISGLTDRNINVIKVPAKTTTDEILAYAPDGIVISNGPGDPTRPQYLIKTTRELINEKIPMFGICMGLQIISLACGAEIYKLKFGHRGSNHPVKDLKTGRVYITSQNHGYAVSEKSVKPLEIEISHINLNDKSVEGIKHKKLPVTAVQYHPEAHCGPWDNYYLFDEFLEMMQ